MKAQGPGQRGTAGGGRKTSMPRLSPLPIEWMDPMSWRLPSGKALAEFALQAGFLAPLMLSGPHWKRTSKVKRADPPLGIATPVAKEVARPVEDDQEPARSIRETR